MSNASPTPTSAPENTNRGAFTVGAIVLAIVLFFAVNLIVTTTLQAQRVDLTSDRLFTVTDTTRNVIGSLEEPITLSFYASSRLLDAAPSLRLLSDRVNELLSTYERIGNGMVRVERINPEPFSVEEDRAVSYGLRGSLLNETGERGYFGLVGTNSVDGLEVIEQLSPAAESVLEYDLTRMVHRLGTLDEPVVGFMDGIGMFGVRERGRPPWAVIQMVNENYDLRDIELNIPEIPADVDVLVIAHPVMMTDQAKYAVDQFVMRGGPVLLFLDAEAENSAPNPQNPNEPQFPASDLEPLMTAWGVDITDDRVVGDRSMAIRLSGIGPGGQRLFVDDVTYLQVRRNSFNVSDPITSQLQLMRMTEVGELTHLPNSVTTFIPLIQTSPESMLYEERVVRTKSNPQDLLNAFQPSGIPRVLAARVQGPAATAYPDGPPPPPETQPDDEPAPFQDPAAQIRENPSINVIVVSDTDMLHNTHLFSDQGQPVGNNPDFILNAIDNLAGGEALLGLRGRGLAFRPFTTIEELRAEAESRTQATEQQLTQELQETEDQLAQLQAPISAGGRATLTAEQQETIADFNRRALDLRQQLRGVQADLRRDIENLEFWLRLANIALIPGLLILLGVILVLWRNARLSAYLKSRQAT